MFTPEDHAHAALPDEPTQNGLNIAEGFLSLSRTEYTARMAILDKQAASEQLELVR